MNRPPSRLRHLKAPLLLLYVIFIIVFLLKANPTLFDQKSFMHHLSHEKNDVPIPLPSVKSEKEDNVFKLSQKGKKSHVYYRQSSQDLISGNSNFSSSEFAMDNLGFYYLLDSKVLSATDLEGHVRWSFELKEDGEGWSGLPSLGDKFLYISTKDGRLYSLDKETGKLNWFVSLNQNLISFYYFANDFLLVALTGEKENTFRLAKINASNAKLIWTSKAYKAQISAPIVFAKDYNLILVATEAGALLAIDADSKKTSWKFQTSDKVMHAPTINGSRVYIANQENEAFAVTLKSGREKWKYELSDAPITSFKIIPEYQSGTIIVKNGYIHSLSLKSGEGKWKYNTRNSEQLASLIPVQLKSSSITKFELPWKYKGWTLWAPCVEDRICIFNPGTGQQLWRLKVRGQLLSLLKPTPGEKTFYAVIKDSEAGNKLKMANFAHYKGKKSPATEPKENQ